MPELNLFTRSIFVAILAGRHLLTFMLAVFLPDKAPQMAPTSAMIPQDSPKIPPRGLKMAPRLVQLPSRWGQDGAKCIKMYKVLKSFDPKILLLLREIDVFRIFVFSGPFRPYCGPSWCQVGSRRFSRGLKTVPRWPPGLQDLPDGPGFGPKTAQDGPEMGSRRARGGNLMKQGFPCRM